MQKKKKNRKICVDCRNGCYRFVVQPVLECAKRPGTGGRSCLMQLDEGCSNFEAREEGQGARFR